MSMHAAIIPHAKYLLLTPALPSHAHTQELVEEGEDVWMLSLVMHEGV